MNEPKTTAGYFRSGLPYNRCGNGHRILVVFQGLVFENKPMAGFMTPFFLGSYKSLRGTYTIYFVIRKPGLPTGYSMKDMSDDYAAMIKEEFGGPVDIIGVSTGGSIAQHFAADHPDLVGKLVIHSSAYTLSDAAKRLQLDVGTLAREGRWRAAFAALADFAISNRGIMKYVAKPIAWIGSIIGAMLGAPRNPSDLVVTVEAEDKHDFKDRLPQIAAPTLVVAGDRDPFYTVGLFRATADGIPNAKLILYKGMGHPASGKQFDQDLMTFLNEDNGN